jgi:hypothetical protein
MATHDRMKDSEGLYQNCYPGMYPKGRLPEDAPESEGKVWAKLSEALPPNWYAWHSVKMRTDQGGLVEGDFLIADPSGGVLILEVKGGVVSKQDGKWIQNGKPMKHDPMRQAVWCRASLVNIFKSRRMWSPAIGEAVCFPDTEYEVPPTQGDLLGRVIGARELPYLEEVLPELMEKATERFRERKPDKGWVKLIHDLWCENWPKAMDLSMRTREEIEKRIKLDESQVEALWGIRENHVVLVSGGAGTGKTLLARELAKKEADEGRKVLLLTFTDALGIELAEDLKETNVVVSPIGRFALERLRKFGFEDEEVYEPGFWEKVTRKAAKSKNIWKRCKWDSVIVDEGQDFGKHEWRIVSRCARKNTRMWVLRDPAQAFWADREIPEYVEKRGVRYSLGRAFRCPPGVQALADAYAGMGESEGKGEYGAEELDKSVVADGSVPGAAALEAARKAAEAGTLKVVGVEAGDVHAEVGKEIDSLLEQGFKPGEIAVLSLRGLMLEENIVHLGELGGHKMVKATHEQAADNIVCDTFLRFKGLERPAVIVTDLRYVDDSYATRMNIAVSRAMGVLRIVGAREEIEKDGILAGLRLI